MTKKEITKQTPRSLTDNTGNLKKRNVCFYARVSTQKELQKTSFDLQVTTYYKEITKNPLWSFSGIFADYGKSGTNISSRVEFNKMIELARLGQIDLIITKSVSRFTRDIVDGLKIIQELRTLGVEVYFEKENMSTLDSIFDFFLTVYLSVAEEESKANSTNVLWSYKKKMEKGLNTTSKLYGYTFDSKGNFIINKHEAKAVKLIYELYVSGYKTNDIIKKLKDNGYKTKTGRDEFSLSAIKGILKNEKYVGDMLLQKTTVKELGARTSVVNKTKNQYYVENNHEGIIDRDLFDKAQNIINERIVKYSSKSRTISNNIYSSYVYSTFANKFYRTKTNHKNTKHEVRLLQLLDQNQNRILEQKTIYYSQIDMLLSEATKALLSDLKDTKRKILNELLLKATAANIEGRIKDLDVKTKMLSDKIKSVNNSNIDDLAKKDLIQSLTLEYDLNIKLTSELRHELLMKYNYDKNLPKLERKLKSLDDSSVDALKDIFSYCIAVDRENLILCIHLSNRNIKDIDLSNEIKNKSIFDGTFSFKQTRLLLTIKWHIIVI